MSNNEILIVDDEKEIADLLEVYLKNENYNIHKFYSPIDALAHIENTPISLVILDVMMPEMDGFTLCQKIRERHFFPIIMLTAKTDDVSKIQGLSLGADDYITSWVCWKNRTAVKLLCVDRRNSPFPLLLQTNCGKKRFPTYSRTTV